MYSSQASRLCDEAHTVVASSGSRRTRNYTLGVVPACAGNAHEMLLWAWKGKVARHAFNCDLINRPDIPNLLRLAHPFCAH